MTQARGIELLGRNAALLLAPFMSLSAGLAGFEAPSVSTDVRLPTVPDPARARSKRSPVRVRSEKRRSICYAPVQPPEVQTPTPAPRARNVHQPSNKSPSGSPQLAKPQKDIRVAEFRTALQEQGFVFLKQAGRFVDRRGSAYRTCLPVTDERGRMRRRETLAALKAWRADFEAGLAAKAALQQQRIALAERLAPKAMPGCRADLTDAAAIAQLADDFLTRVSGFGSIDFKALIHMGWSAAQLREHGDAARVLADRKAVAA